MNRIITLAICSANTLFREGIRRILSDEKPFRIIDTPLRFEGATAWIQKVRPDVIVYDPKSISVETLHAIAGIKRESSKSKIIVLLEDFEEDFVIAAIRSGADGCIMKAASPSELIKAIYSIEAGELWLSRHLFARVVDRSKENGARTSAFAKLTPRELQVVELVSQGLSNKEIAERLYVSDKTVKSHLNDVFRKLHLNHRVQLALYFVKNHSYHCG